MCKMFMISYIYSGTQRKLLFLFIYIYESMYVSGLVVWVYIFFNKGTKGKQ